MTSDQDIFIWQYTDEQWVAVGTVGLVAATLILAFVAGYTIRAARKDAKLNRTLLACDKYDLDPVLNRALRHLRFGFVNYTIHSDPKKYTDAARLLLNYLDSICIGLKHKVYDKRIVYEHFENIFLAHYEEYFGSARPKLEKVEPKYFEAWCDICIRWKVAAQQKADHHQHQALRSPPSQGPL